MRSLIRPAVVSFVMLTIVTGVVYPAIVTVVAKLAFPRQAAGSLILRDGKPVGSESVGQWFSAPRYFWPRPSATLSADGKPLPYNAALGAGSNMAPTNPALVEAVKARIAALKAADPDNTQPIPVDLVTASASGLDPHISVAAAKYQIARIARVRHLTDSQIARLVDECTDGRTFGILGEPRVNVLRLNMALDAQRR